MPRKFGVPAKSESLKRTCGIRINLTAGERAALYQAAVKSRTTVSDLVRRIIFSYGKEESIEDTRRP